MRIILVNQFAPPDEAPTAVLMGELGAHLRACGHEVEFIEAGQDYRKADRGARDRIFRELRAHASILWRLATARRADAIIALSSPPCLLFTAAAGAWLHGAKLGHWAMDVYPEIAAALGEIGHGGRTYRLTDAAMAWGYARCRWIAALDADMARRLAQRGAKPTGIVPPWPPEGIASGNLDPAPAGAGAGDRPDFTWLYSGNLGRAHEWETLLDAQAILEDRLGDAAPRLVFQGAGPCVPPARERAEALRLQRCEFRGYAPRGELIPALLAADVLIATQRPEAAGLLCTEQTGGHEIAPRAILWVGDPRGHRPRDGSAPRRLRARRCRRRRRLGRGRDGARADARRRPHGRGARRRGARDGFFRWRWWLRASA
ncbi:MAG: hypothetical protein R3F11_18350 [Verrucomicrobiales bacterium]